MNIFFYRYNSICEPSFISCFKQAGINVIEDTYEIHHKNSSGDEMIKRIHPIFENYKILFAISINFFPALSAICNIYKIPYISVIVDCPVFELYSHEIQNPVNRIFIFDREQWKIFHKYNPDCIFHLPLCADINSYSNTITTATDEEKHKYSCDISFIGSLYTEKCDYYSDKQLNPYTKGFIDALVSSSTGLFGSNIIYESLTDIVVDNIYNCYDLYKFPEKSYKDRKAVVANNVIGTKISEEERILVLKSLSETGNYNIDLYTGSNTSRLLKVNNKGFAKTLTEMPLIFHQSKINLNITSKTIKTGISQRVFDVLACGGFLLSNIQEELFEFFTPGKDLETFSCIDELLEKVDFYLLNDSLRQTIAQHGYNTVKKFHSTETRIEQILSYI